MRGRRRASLVLALAALACSSEGGGGGGAAAPDAATGLDGAGADRAGDAPVEPADAGQEIADAGDDAVVSTKPPPSGLPLPAGVPPPRRFLPAGWDLTGQGLSSCSHQEPASADGHRHCVFMRPGSAAGHTELWVMDISRAASGDVPPCDGSDAGCLRLTTNLWTDGTIKPGPIHPYSHEFYGDTLIFYADAPIPPSNEPHRGPVFAWRPGWPAARRISGPRAIGCWAHEQLPLLQCWEDLTGNLDHAEAIELSVGPLPEGTGDVTLPSLGRMPIPANRGPLAWQARYTPGGELYAYTMPEAQSAMDTLRVIAPADVGRVPPKEILRDVHEWDLSPSGERIYFFRPEPLGGRALWTADFPSGAHETKIAAGVQSYVPLSEGSADRGLAFTINLNDQVGTLRVLRDPLLPASAVSVFSYTDMLEDVAFSPDQRFVAWSNGHFDMRVVRNQDLTSCPLNNLPDHGAFSPAFTDSAGLIFWREDSPDVAERLDGYVANPDGCSAKRRIGLGVHFAYPVGNRAVIIGDEYDDQVFTVSLKYALLGDGGKTWPEAGPVRLHADVDDSFVVPVGARPMYLVFKVKQAGRADGGESWVFGPAPF